MTDRERNPLAKAFQALEYMAASERRGETLGEIAAGIGISSSTLHRVLGMLENEGLIQQDANRGRYALGPKFLQIARMAVSRRSVGEIVRPWLTNLRNQTGETAWYGVYENASHAMRFLESIQSTHALRHVRDLDTPVSIFASGAAGRVVLALLSENEQAILLASADAASASASFTDRSQLDSIRERGYAVSVSGRSGVGIAAPVLDARQRLQGVVGIGFPRSRHDEDDEPNLVAFVREAADRIGKEIS